MRNLSLSLSLLVSLLVFLPYYFSCLRALSSILSSTLFYSLVFYSLLFSTVLVYGRLPLWDGPWVKMTRTATSVSYSSNNLFLLCTLL